MSKKSTKPTIPEVLDRFVAYHYRNPAWGVLHIVLEDGNIDDGHVRACINDAEDAGDQEAKALARTLLAMSKTQRRRLPRLVYERSRETCRNS